MLGILKAAFAELVALTAPVVTLFYRRGWFLTPDDPVSPFGQYEPTMQRIYSRLGPRFGDWWWLGIRNRAYGLSYALKPDHFKRMTDYRKDVLEASCKQRGRLRTISIDGFKEYTLSLGFFHIIAGYRLRPVWDELFNDAPYRAINMDARPIISIRAGANDD